MSNQEISEKGRRERFTTWENLGLDRVKYDLQNGGHRVVGGPAQEQELAWEWVRLEEAKIAQGISGRSSKESTGNNGAQASLGTWAVPGSRFSRRTVFAALEVIEGRRPSAAELTRIFLKWGGDLAARCDAGSVKDRFNHIMRFVDEDPARHTADGDLLQDVIVNEAVALLPSYDWGLLNHHAEPKEAFLRALDLNGFTVRENALIQTLPSELELPQAEDDTSRLLTKHGFTISKGHLDQALASHGRGDWASANSQLRAFYEGLFEEIAVKLDPSAASLASSENRRARLASIGFIKENLNEWGNDGKNFVNGLFKRLHPAGSHPGLSDQEDSTFRRHIVLLTAKLFLIRLDNWPGTP